MEKIINNYKLEILLFALYSLILVFVMYLFFY